MARRNLTENVDFPDRVKPSEVADLRDAGTVLGRNKGLRCASAPQVSAGTYCSSLGSFHHGQSRTDDDYLLCAGLLQSCERDVQSGAAGECAIDQRIQFAVVQRAPPFGCNGNAVGSVIGGGSAPGDEALRQRRFGRGKVGTDSTSG